MAVELLRDDAAFDDGRAAGPGNLKSHMLDILDNSGEALQQIETVLDRHSQDGAGQSAWWTISGKEKIGSLQKLLSIQRSSLALALDIAYG